MTQLHIGDIVSCKIKSSIIVSPYKAYDEIKTFVIIAKDECGYYLFVPHYRSINDSVVADVWLCSSLSLPSKYLNENIVYIDASLVYSVARKQDGTVCRLCKELFPYALPNRPDGSLICYSCRQSRYH